MRDENKKRTGWTGRRALAAGFIALAAALALLALLLGLDARHVRFYMNRSEEISVPYGQPYEDPGVRAVTVGRLSGEGRRELPVQVSGEVDAWTLGEYELNYTARSLLHSYSVRRVVHVVDEKAPAIVLEHREDYHPSWLEGYEEEGWSAYDELDGDLTAAVRVEEQGDTRVYTVADAAGNEARAVRELPYSIGTPILTLLGGDYIELRQGTAFSDPGLLAADARGNDLGLYVQKEGAVDTEEPGDYTLRYWIENALGERVEATRQVHVEPLRNPDRAEPGDRVICLTFDDGPGPYTDALLDVLKRYNVRATFFVTCRYPDYFDCIGRAAREGHSVGVHSASHRYSKIYASEEAFFEDFDEVQRLILAQTGSESAICRFPGGSSNTVSRFNRGIMTRLTQALDEIGYVWFDWNVSSGDAGETTSSEQVFQNIVSGCEGKDYAIVLQHDIKDFSVAAVERVIRWGLEQGYVFEALNESSEPVRHQLAN